MRHAYIVSIDTDTGEAVAAEISREQVNRLTIAAGAPRAVECNGRGAHWDAARDALSSIMPEPDADPFPTACAADGMPYSPNGMAGDPDPES